MKKETIAEVLKIGLATRLIEKVSISNWADYLIQNDNYDDNIISLSMLGSKSNNEILSLLNQISENNADKNIVKCIFLSYLNIEYLKSPWTWYNLEGILVEILDMLDIIDDFSFRLRDDYFLRKDRLSGNMDQPMEMEKYLDSFKDYNAYLLDLGKYGITISI